MLRHAAGSSRHWQPAKGHSRGQGGNAEASLRSAFAVFTGARAGRCVAPKGPLLLGVPRREPSREFLENS